VDERGNIIGIVSAKLDASAALAASGALPEQSLVLGIGAARRVPSWNASKDRFVPVMEANLTLSFDHRVIDGGAAGRLLMRIADLIMHPEQL